jgi:hypothetical protein
MKANLQGPLQVPIIAKQKKSGRRDKFLFKYDVLDPYGFRSTPSIHGRLMCIDKKRNRQRLVGNTKFPKHQKESYALFVFWSWIVEYLEADGYEFVEISR